MIIRKNRSAGILKRSAAFAAVLGLGLAGCGAPSATPAPESGEAIDLVLDWNSYVAYHAPFIVAEEQGIFEKHGVSVTHALSGGSKDAVLAAGTGQADIAWADLSTAATSMLSGLPVKAVAAVQDKNATGLTVLEETELDDAQDVVGLRIGSTPGGSDSTLIGAFLKRNNIREGEVTIVNLPANGKFTALMTGKVDAISGQVYFYVTAAEGEGKPAHGKSFSEMGTDALDHGFVASNDFISENPGAVTSFLAAYREALKITIDDPAAACSLLSNRSDGALTKDSCEQQLDLWLELVTPVDNPEWGMNAPEKWDDTVGILKTFGGATGDVETGEMYTNDLLPEATP